MDTASDRSDDPEFTERPANVLLRAPQNGPEPSPCPDDPGPATRRLLVVSLRGDPDARIDARRKRRGLPEDVAILASAGTRCAAAAAGVQAPETTAGGTTLSWATVDSAGALGDLGVTIDRCLTSWEANGPGVEVCFDSVSAVLADADLPAVYRFIHVLQRRVRGAGATAHYHLDPARHSPRVTSTVETLFDHVYEYDPGTGTWVRA